MFRRSTTVLLIAILPPGGADADATSDRPDRRGGETIESAVRIVTLPFEDTGSTCGYQDDYDEVCYWSSTSPDVVYGYTAPRDMALDIQLCDSAYDTKCFVYERTHTPGDPFACNDDRCGADGFESELLTLEVFQGETYYIVVDGYGGACGDYVIEVRESVPCIVECPPGSEREGEPVCHDGYVDEFNAGCCCDTIRFSILEPSSDRIHVCGQGGTFPSEGFDMRDDDWYEITPSQASSLRICTVAQYSVSIALLDGREGCENPPFLAFGNGGPCTEVCLDQDVEAGTYWIWTAPSFFTGIPCPSDYRLTIDGYLPGATHAAASSSPASAPILQPCSPDPFVSETSLAFELPRSARVRLTIHRVDGRRVTTLIDRRLPAGPHSLVWRGRDGSGGSVPSGVYFGILDVDGHRQSRRMVRLQ